MDEQARKILLSAYWGSAGWKSGEVSDEDFDYCKSHGVMFDSRNFKHAQLVRQTIEAREALKPREVGDAFTCSLSSRDLWLRSALGSYGNCRHLKQHRFRAHDMRSMSYLCEVCSCTRSERVDSNVLNFERIKWSGVRHSDLSYNVLDLQLLTADLPCKPRRDDKRILKKLISETKASVKSQEGSGKLKKRWKDHLASNPNELNALLEIFLYADIIQIDGTKVVNCCDDAIDRYFG